MHPVLTMITRYGQNQSCNWLHIRVSPVHDVMESGKEKLNLFTYLKWADLDADIVHSV